MATDKNADLETQLEQLRKEIGDIAASIAGLTTKKAADLKGDAIKAGNDALGASSEALETARERINAAGSDIGDRVREKPLQALAVAAGIGFLAALLTRRV